MVSKDVPQLRPAAAAAEAPARAGGGAGLQRLAWRAPAGPGGAAAPGQREPADGGRDFPPELHDHLDWAPPARMKVGKGLYGPRTADMAERLGLSPSPCEKLVPFLDMHVEEGVDGKRLKFLRTCSRVWRLRRAYRFACSPFMAGFMELKHSERRQLKAWSPRRW